MVCHVPKYTSGKSKVKIRNDGAEFWDGGAD